MTQASLFTRLGTNRRWGAYFQFDRNVYILLLFTLGKGFQLSIGALAINLYVSSLGYQNDAVGVVAAMSAVGALVAAVPVGVLADRIGRKPLLIFSGLLTPLTLVMLALSTSLPLLITANLLNGMIASAYWVTNLPMITESTTGEQRVNAMAANNFLLLGVGALGALIGGEVPQLVGAITHLPADSVIPLRWGVLSAAILVLLPALPLFTIVEPRRARRAKALEVALPPPLQASEGEYGALAAAREIAETAPAQAADEEEERKGIVGLFVKLLLPDVLFTTGEGAVVVLFAIFLSQRFAVQPGEIGLLLTGAGLLGGTMSLAAPRLVRRWGRLRLATWMQFASIPAILAIGFLPFLPLVALAEFVRQILRGVFEPIYVTFAMERVSARRRGMLSGFYSLTWSLGFSIGPVAAGLLQTNVGLSASFIVGAALVGGSATLLRVFFPRA